MDEFPGMQQVLCSPIRRSTARAAGAADKRLSSRVSERRARGTVPANIPTFPTFIASMR